QGRVVVNIGILKQSRDGIEPEPRRASLEPEAQGVVHGLADLRIPPVQVRLFRIKVMVVILICRRVQLPGGMAKPGLPVVGRLAGFLSVAPDVPVALGICTRRTRLHEPGVLCLLKGVLRFRTQGWSLLCPTGTCRKTKPDRDSGKDKFSAVQHG